MPTRTTWLTVLAWFAGSRLVIAALGAIGVATFLDQHTLQIGGAAAFHLETVWHKWDVLWYERIALHGYGWHIQDLKGQAAASFFPLYPVAVGLLLRALPIVSFFWMGTIVSNLLSFVAMGLMAGQLAENEQHARRALFVMAAAAGSFYLSIPYTESLLLLLTVLVLIATRRRHYVLAAALAGLAAVTRAQGAALVAVPAVACWLDAELPVRARTVRLAAMLALAAVPLAIYMAYLSAVQGSAGAFVERQALWGNAVPYPFRTLAGLVQFPRRPQAWLHGSFWILYMGLLIRYWRRLPLGEALFCLGALVISTQQESFRGVYRYVVPLVPLALALAADRDEIRRPVIIFNIIFATVMILAFVTNNRLAV